MSRILEPNLESDSGAEFLGLPGEDAPSVYCREGLYNAFFLCFENSKIVSLTNKIARGFLSNLGSCSYQKVFFFFAGFRIPLCFRPSLLSQTCMSAKLLHFSVGCLKFQCHITKNLVSDIKEIRKFSTKTITFDENRARTQARVKFKLN